MNRSIMGAVALVLWIVISGVPAAAIERSGSDTASASTIVAKYAGLRSFDEAVTTMRPVISAAACNVECCCQVYDGNRMTHQCKSRDDCINAGGICRPKTDASCK